MSRLTKDSQLAKTVNIRKLPRVELVWVDAISTGGWTSLKDYRAKRTLTIESIGYLTKNTKQEVQLVQSRSDIGNVADAITIPKKWIISAKYLSKPR